MEHALIGETGLLDLQKKREAYRKAINDFDYNRVARYTQEEIDRLLVDPGILRNRFKIESAIKNARGVRLIRDVARCVLVALRSAKVESEINILP